MLLERTSITKKIYLYKSPVEKVFCVQILGTYCGQEQA